MAKCKSVEVTKIQWDHSGDAATGCVLSPAVLVLARLLQNVSVERAWVSEPQGRGLEKGLPPPPPDIYVFIHTHATPQQGLTQNVASEKFIFE